ncbi:MAG: YbjQ family protein [SAR202 cluster bacterium]|nr:YbjQ family protein [SAR202 cluster bacterium]
MVMTTTDQVPGAHVVKVLGLVHANSVRGADLARQIVGAVRTAVRGGKIPDFDILPDEFRNQALAKLATKASELGANAIVGVRFGTSEITSGISEVIAYGTAVVVEQEERK